MDTTLSEAAANRCPILGWNLTCAIPPYVKQELIIQCSFNNWKMDQDQMRKEGTNLKNTSTGEGIDIPIANFIVIITETE